MSSVIFTNTKGLFIGVDWGQGKDIAVESVYRKNPNGTLDIISIDYLGRSSDITEEEKDLRERTYEEFSFKETVDEESAG